MTAHLEDTWGQTGRPMQKNELALFDQVKDMTVPEIRSFIAAVEQRLVSGDYNGEPIDVPINHHFSQDVYAREMIVPKGAIIIGKIHKYQNLNILSKGEVSIVSIDGVMRVKAPFTFVASPGAKRLFVVHEDAVWTVVHGTAETDIDKIESKFIVKTYEELDSKEIKCLG